MARRSTGAEGTTTLEVRRAQEAGDLDFLIDCLATGDRVARVAAAGALGDLGVRKSVDALLRCAQARDWFLRATAITALGKIGDAPPMGVLTWKRRERNSRCHAVQESHATPSP